MKLSMSFTMELRRSVSLMIIPVYSSSVLSLSFFERSCAAPFMPPSGFRTSCARFAAKVPDIREALFPEGFVLKDFLRDTSFITAAAPQRRPSTSKT